MTKKNDCIIIFTKAPIKGFVKTRLAKDIGEKTVVSLYRNFVKDILCKTASSGHEIKIFYYPQGAESIMHEWLGKDYEFILQSGADLGQKMANAFDYVFKTGIEHVILMGTDFPDLPGKIISDALSGLETHDAVLGPTIDGGYYLIGFNKGSFHPEVFKGMPWSTPAVFQKTIHMLSSFQIKTLQLPQWRDIDDYDDLKKLIRSIKNHPHKANHTFSFLEKMDMI